MNATIETPVAQPRTAAEFFAQQVDALLDDIAGGQIGDHQAQLAAHDLLVQMSLAKQDGSLDFDWDEVKDEVARLVLYLPPDERDGWTETPYVMSFNANQKARRKLKALPFSKLATLSAMRSSMVKMLVTGRETAKGLTLADRKTLAKGIHKSIREFNQLAYLHFPSLAVKGRDVRYLWVLTGGNSLG